MPKTYQHALLKFGLFAGLEEKEAEEFSAFARLRNILAHEYLIFSRNTLRNEPKVQRRAFGFRSTSSGGQGSP